MAAIDSIIRITITDAATPVATTSTTIPLLVADAVPAGWPASQVVKSYGGLDELIADGFDPASPTATYVTKLLSQAVKPAVFLVGRKAAGTLATSDLDAIQAADDSFYAIIVVEASDAEILTCAEWTQAQRKMFFAASATAAIGDPTDTSNIAAQLKAQSMTRTALMFSPGSATQGIEAAWVGGQIPLTPGNNTWAAQILDGIAVDNISTSVARAIVGSPIDGSFGNGANIYRLVAQRGQTQMGTTSGLTFIDNMIGEDWLYFNLQSSVFSVLGNGTAKIPYTDRGVGLLEAQVFSVLQQGDANGLIATGSYSTSAAKVADVPATQRAARVSPTIYFQCRLTGAIHAVAISGQISL